jgi:hypothetical protein
MDERNPGCNGRERSGRLVEKKDNFVSDVNKFIHTHIQGVTERCGQTLGTSSTYQNKKKCPYQHVSGNI